MLSRLCCACCRYKRLVPEDEFSERELTESRSGHKLLLPDVKQALMDFRDAIDNDLDLCGESGWAKLSGATEFAQLGKCEGLRLQGDVLFIDLSFNALSGELPLSFIGLVAKMRQIEKGSVSLTQNKGFSLPSSIAGLDVTELDLSRTSLISISSDIGDLKALRELDLSGNALECLLPLSIGALKAAGCKVAVDSGLELSGDVSCVRGARALDFAHLGLRGELPLPLIKLACIDILCTAAHADANDTEDADVTEYAVEQGNSRIDLALFGNNSFILPRDLAELAVVQVTTLDLGCSGLTGEIPPSIGHCTLLRSLVLCRNDLCGEIPRALEDCPLQRLDLSRNPRLSGSLPYKFWRDGVDVNVTVTAITVPSEAEASAAAAAAAAVVAARGAGGPKGPKVIMMEPWSQSALQLAVQAEGPDSAVEAQSRTLDWQNWYNGMGTGGVVDMKAGCSGTARGGAVVGGAMGASGVAAEKKNKFYAATATSAAAAAAIRMGAEEYQKSVDQNISVATKVAEAMTKRSTSFEPLPEPPPVSFGAPAWPMYLVPRDVILRASTLPCYAQLVPNMHRRTPRAKGKEKGKEEDVPEGADEDGRDSGLDEGADWGETGSMGMGMGMSMSMGGNKSTGDIFESHARRVREERQRAEQSRERERKQQSARDRQRQKLYLAMVVGVNDCGSDGGSTTNKDNSTGAPQRRQQLQLMSSDCDSDAKEEATEGDEGARQDDSGGQQPPEREPEPEQEQEQEQEHRRHHLLGSRFTFGSCSSGSEPGLIIKDPFSTDECRKFGHHNSIPLSVCAFFSHRQTIQATDTQYSKLRCMQRILLERPMCEEHAVSGTDLLGHRIREYRHGRGCEACRRQIEFVWFDFCCAPAVTAATEGANEPANEHHKQLEYNRTLATRSLPFYVQHCGKFFALHGRDEGLDHYLRGGWCRLELLLAQCKALQCSGQASSALESEGSETVNLNVLLQMFCADYDSEEVKELRWDAHRPKVEGRDAMLNPLGDDSEFDSDLDNPQLRSLLHDVKPGQNQLLRVLRQIKISIGGRPQ